MTIKFEPEYFREFVYTAEAINKFIVSARKDMNIAQSSPVPDVIFQFSYSAFLKIGLALIASAGYKVRSKSGHHLKIIEAMAAILGDKDIAVYGNRMRKTRNTELYDGGLLISEKEAEAYRHFIEKVFLKAEIIFKNIQARCFKDYI